MGVALGDSGIVNGADTVRQWVVEYFEDDKPYAATNTSAGTDRACGVKDWNGQWFAYGGKPSVFPGDALTFTGESVSTDGASGTAISSRAQIYWEQEQGDYCQHVVHFEGNGTLTLGSIADQSDASIPNPYCGANLKVYWAGVEVADVRRAYLDIMRMHGKPPGQLGNVPYSSTSVPGSIRRIKGRLDWRAFVDCYVATYAAAVAVFALQDEQILKIYTNATEYWEMTWGRITRLENIGAHPEASELLGIRVHFAMAASNGASLGTVYAPGATKEWPD